MNGDKWNNGDPISWKHASITAYGKAAEAVRISVASTAPGFDQVAESEEVQHAMYKARSEVLDAFRRQLYRADPETQEQITQQRRQLLSLFDGERIFVEELPNGYSAKDPWFSLFPWFRITTSVGHFTVGARKSVIVIDWEASVVLQTANELFPGESVTKIGRLIHAHSLSDAGSYVRRVLAAGKTKPEAL